MTLAARLAYFPRTSLPKLDRLYSDRNSFTSGLAFFIEFSFPARCKSRADHSDSGSRNAVEASSNETSCFRKLAEARFGIPGKSHAIIVAGGGRQHRHVGWRLWRGCKRRGEHGDTHLGGVGHDALTADEGHAPSNARRSLRSHCRFDWPHLIAATVPGSGYAVVFDDSMTSSRTPLRVRPMRGCRISATHRPSPASLQDWPAMHPKATFGPPRACTPSPTPRMPARQSVNSTFRKPSILSTLADDSYHRA